MREQLGRASWSILLFTAFLGTSGCTFINNLIGSEKRVVYKFDHPFNADNPAFRRSAEALGLPMVEGNQAVILQNGDAIIPAMIGEIHNARKTVNLESYIFQADEAGRLFTDALIAAARRGVQVRLLIDDFGGKLKGFKKELDAAGVMAHKYRPMRLFSIYKIGNRTHRKILVVDGRVAYTGGLGIDKRWMGDARNQNEWRDTQVRVEGPVAGQMQSIFAEDWTYTTGEILAGDDYYPENPRVGSIRAQAIKASHGDSSSLAKMLYYVAIQSAEHSIHIANAYFLPDKQVREALIAAVKRGVDVQVMVPGSNIDMPMVRFASWSHYGDMLKSGVHIYEYQPTMLHNKTVVIDGIYSIIGSINFDTRSMSSNAEEALAFYDRDFASQMEEMFQNDKKSCGEITYQAWDDRGIHRRIIETIFWIWEPYY
ncbi:MAG TPA: phospholipase D-like domain-containing protein [Thermoanaerobaculia bacterium]